jgi:hypothetical protein
VAGLAGGGGEADCCSAAARSRASKAMRYRSFSDMPSNWENSGLGTHGGGSSSGAGPELSVVSRGMPDEEEDMTPSEEPKLNS